MIGIIGGIGPAAGINLAEKIIETDEGKLDQERAPLLLYSDPCAVPSRNDFLLGRSEVNPAYNLADIIRKIVPMGVRLVAIACNAAHSNPIFSVLQEEIEQSGIPARLLHLIKLFADYLVKETNYRRVGVLSIAGTYRAGAYSTPFCERGLEVLELSDDLVEMMHDVVWNKEFGLKAHSNPVHPEAKRRAEMVMDAYIKNGADAIILGCTEYPLLLKDTAYRDVPILDANRYFAEIIIREYEKIKNI